MNSDTITNRHRRIFASGQKLPEPVRIMIGAVLSIIIIVLTPILALIAVDWSYIIRKVWEEIVVEWAIAVKQLLWAATRGNQWFKTSKKA